MMDRLLRAEISASALVENLDTLRALAGEGCAVCPVVKAEAYGHGLATVLPVLRDRVDALAVATPEEALQLRELGFARPVLVFFGVAATRSTSGLVESLAEKDITLTIASKEDLSLIEEAIRSSRPVPRVHLKIDTGMNRSGLPLDQAVSTLQQLRTNEAVRLTGAYTHFATADEGSLDFAQEQLDRFLSIVDRGGGREGLTLHCANSAAAMAFPPSRLSMIRPGIAIYGCRPSPNLAPEVMLRPVLRLLAPLLQVKDVKAGDGTGYGLDHKFERSTRIGLVPIGYADGYLRSLGDRSVVGIRGKLAPLRGRVSMDQIVVDLGGVPDAQVGDKVEIIASDPQLPNSAEGLATIAKTIPYEILSRLGHRIERRLID